MPEASYARLLPGLLGTGADFGALSGKLAAVLLRRACANRNRSLHHGKAVEGIQSADAE